MALSYREVLERYDRAKAFGETGSLVEYATKLNDAYQTNDFSEGLRDGPWTRFSTRLDQNVFEPIAEATTAPVFEAIGGAFGHAEAGRAVGMGLPRMGAQIALSAVPYVGTALMAGAFGGHTYADTGSTPAALLSGGVAGVMPMAGRFAGNVAARAFGVGEKVVGDYTPAALAQLQASRTAAGLAEATNPYFSATLPVAGRETAFKAARFGGEQLSTAALGIGQGIVTNKMLGGPDDYNPLGPDFWMMQIPWTVMDALRLRHPAGMTSAEGRKLIVPPKTAAAPAERPAYIAPPKAEVEQANVEAVVNRYAENVVAGKVDAKSTTDLIDAVTNPTSVSAALEALKDKAVTVSTEPMITFMGKATKMETGDWRVLVHDPTGQERKAVFVKGAEPVGEPNEVGLVTFTVPESQVTLAGVQPRPPKVMLDPQGNPVLEQRPEDVLPTTTSGTAVSAGGGEMDYTPYHGMQPEEPSALSPDEVHVASVATGVEPAVIQQRIVNTLPKTDDLILNMFQGKIQEDAQGRVVRLGNTDVAVDGWINETRFVKTTQLPADLIPAFKETYPEAFNEKGEVNATLLLKGIRERPMVETKKLGTSIAKGAIAKRVQELDAKRGQLQHDLETKAPGWEVDRRTGHVISPDNKSMPLRQAMEAEPSGRNFPSDLVDLVTQIKQVDMEIGNAKLPDVNEPRSRYAFLTDKPEAEMKGYVEGLVRMPVKEQQYDVVNEQGSVVARYNTLAEARTAAADRGPRFKAVGRDEAIKFTGPHFGSEDVNVLAHWRGYEEGNVFKVVEVQSDWGQHVSAQKSGSRPTAPVAEHPLLSSYETLALQSILQHVRELNAKAVAEGRTEDVITHVDMPTGETAMMTQGHDKQPPRRNWPQTEGGQPANEKVVATAPMQEGENFSDAQDRLQKAYLPEALQKQRPYNNNTWVEKLPNGNEVVWYIGWKFTDESVPKDHMAVSKWEVEVDSRPAQEGGMRAAYDSRLPAGMEKLTGVRGERVEGGVHKQSLKDLDTLNPLTGEMEPNPQIEGSPVFRNPDGTPVTNSRFYRFSLEKVMGGLALDDTLSFKESVQKYDQAQARKNVAQREEVKPLDTQESLSAFIKDWKTKEGLQAARDLGASEGMAVESVRLAHTGTELRAAETALQLHRENMERLLGKDRTPKGDGLTASQRQNAKRKADREAARAAQRAQEATALEEKLARGEKLTYIEAESLGTTRIEAADKQRLGNEDAPETAEANRVIKAFQDFLELGGHRKNISSYLVRAVGRWDKSTGVEGLRSLMHDEIYTKEGALKQDVGSRGEGLKNPETGGVFWATQKLADDALKLMSPELQQSHEPVGAGKGKWKLQEKVTPKVMESLDAPKGEAGTLTGHDKIAEAVPTQLVEDVAPAERRGNGVPESTDRPDNSHQDTLDIMTEMEGTAGLLDAELPEFGLTRAEWDRSRELITMRMEGEDFTGVPHEELKAVAKVLGMTGELWKDKNIQALGSGRYVPPFDEKIVQATGIRRGMRAFLDWVDTQKNELGLTGQLAVLLKPFPEILDRIEVRMHDNSDAWRPGMHFVPDAFALNVGHLPTKENVHEWARNMVHEMVHPFEKELLTRNDAAAVEYRAAKTRVIEALRESPELPKKVKDVLKKSLKNEDYLRYAQDLPGDDGKPFNLFNHWKDALPKDLFEKWHRVMYALVHENELTAQMMSDKGTQALMRATQMKNVPQKRTVFEHFTHILNKLFRGTKETEDALTYLIGSFDNYLTSGLLKNTYNGHDYIHNMLVKTGMRSEAAASRLRAVDRTFTTGALRDSIRAFVTEGEQGLLPKSAQFPEMPFMPTVRDTAGNEFKGAIHGIALEQAALAGVKGPFEEGFTTNRGRFATREESALLGGTLGMMDSSDLGSMKQPLDQPLRTALISGDPADITRAVGALLEPQLDVHRELLYRMRQDVTIAQNLVREIKKGTIRGTLPDGIEEKLKYSAVKLHAMEKALRKQGIAVERKNDLANFTYEGLNSTVASQILHPKLPNPESPAPEMDQAQALMGLKAKTLESRLSQDLQGQKYNNWQGKINVELDNTLAYLQRAEPNIEEARASKELLLNSKWDKPEGSKELIEQTDFTNPKEVAQLKKQLHALVFPLKQKNIEPPSALSQRDEVRRRTSEEEMSGQGKVGWVQKHFQLAQFFAAVHKEVKTFTDHLFQAQADMKERITEMQMARFSRKDTAVSDPELVKNLVEVTKNPVWHTAYNELAQLYAEGQKSGRDMSGWLETKGAKSLLRKLSPEGQKRVLTQITQDSLQHQYFTNQQAPRELGKINHLNTQRVVMAMTPDMPATQASEVTGRLYQAISMMRDPAQVEVGRTLLQQVGTELPPDVFYAALKHANSSLVDTQKALDVMQKHDFWISQKRTEPYGVRMTKDSDGSSFLAPAKTREEAMQIKRQKEAEGYTFLFYPQRADLAAARGGMSQDIYEAFQELDAQAIARAREVFANRPDSADLEARALPLLNRADAYQATTQAFSPLPMSRKLVAGREYIDLLSNRDKFYSGANNWFNHKVARAQAEIDMMHPEIAGNAALKKWSENHLNAYLSPDNPIVSKINEVVFYQRMGLNFGNMFLEAFQSLGTGMQALVAESGSVTNAYALTAKANAELLAHKKTGKWSSPELAWFMRKAEAGGLIEPMLFDNKHDPETHNQLSISGQIGGPVKHGVSAIKGVVRNIGGFFQVYNNKIAMLAAFKLAVERGDIKLGMKSGDAVPPELMDVLNFARTVKDNGTFTGGKAQRPGMFGTIASRPVPQLMSSLTTYVQGWFSQMAKDYARGFGENSGRFTAQERAASKKAFVYGLAAQAVLAGGLGLPGIGQGIAVLNQATGLDLKGWLRQNLATLFGEDQDNGGFLTNLALRGAANAMTPIDPSNRAAISVPFLGVDPYKGFDIANLAGAPGATVSDLVQGMMAAARGDFQGFQKLLPSVLKGPAQLYQGEGDVRDARGALLQTLTPAEKVFQAFGMPSSRIQNARDSADAVSKAERIASLHRAALVDRLAELSRKGQMDEVQRQMLQLRQQQPGLDLKALARSVADRVVAQSIPYSLRHKVNPAVDLAGLTNPQESFDPVQHRLDRQSAQRALGLRPTVSPGTKQAERRYKPEWNPTFQ
jgi:hypothetical protein